MPHVPQRRAAALEAEEAMEEEGAAESEGKCMVGKGRQSPHPRHGDPFVLTGGDLRGEHLVHGPCKTCEA